MENDDLEAGKTTAQVPVVALAQRNNNGGSVIVYVVMIAISLSILLGFVVHVITTPKQILLPTFSVNVDGSDGRQMHTPASTVSPAFNLTLHSASSGSPQSRRLCVDGGSVAVSYAGAVLAWGRVPGFCVAPHEHKDVRMVALGTEVGLSDELRQRMASELAPELDVDIMLRGPAALGRERRLLSCRVAMGSAPSRPSPCRVFVYLVSQ
jgi:hypothetical protein